jgi:hypothetical protein
MRVQASSLGPSVVSLGGSPPPLLASGTDGRQRRRRSGVALSPSPHSEAQDLRWLSRRGAYAGSE